MSRTGRHAGNLRQRVKPDDACGDQASETCLNNHPHHPALFFCGPRCWPAFFALFVCLLCFFRSPQLVCLFIVFFSVAHDGCLFCFVFFLQRVREDGWGASWIGSGVCGVCGEPQRRRR
jgi:hypothetical protein